MTMPDDLILVRHGESIGNVAIHAARDGDLSLFTDKFATTPGHRWEITPTGVAQARCTGDWLLEEFVYPTGRPFDRHYASPFRRTRQTAGHLGLFRDQRRGNLPSGNRFASRWSLNRALRERDWGDIGSISTAEFESRPEYALNARSRATNPLYWTPPGGESIAHVAENRVRNVLDTLHREASGQRVIAITHGETMMAFRLVLERLSDEEYETLDADRTQTLRNCAVLHYSRTGPEPDAARHGYLSWLRRAVPVLTSNGDPADPASWKMHVEPWQPVVFKTYTDAELLG